jgi:XRE family transcriptional regulator, regulator of sulfur utilization
MEQDKDLLLRLGEQVKALRTTRGLSQEALAERAGMSLKHLGEIERAATEPSITAVLGLAKGLEVSVMELIPERGRVTPEPKTLSREDWLRVHEVARQLAEVAERMVQFASRFRRAGAARRARRPPSSRSR